MKLSIFDQAFLARCYCFLLLNKKFNYIELINFYFVKNEIAQLKIG